VTKPEDSLGHISPNTPYNFSAKVRKRILLTTSAAPAQSPFSTKEKRPPIGIGFLISVLRNAGHEVFFIDNYLQPSDFLQTDHLQKNRIDYVGIYANTICFRDTFQMLHKLEHLRNTGQWGGKIIVGGPHTTVAPDTIPDFVDYVVQGEGEHAIVDIVDGKVTDRIVRYPRIENLDGLPMPAWDYFVDLPYTWSVDFFEDKPVFTMNTSRGCPFQCTFCSVGAIWGKKYTYFSAERIVSDIEYLIEHYGARGIYFREDNFTLNQTRLRKFCNLLIERAIKIPWVCESRVSNLSRDLVELMSRAGAKGFYFGVESGSQRILDFLRKDITVEQIKNAFKWCQEFNIKTAASVIVGVPGETDLDLRQTHELLRKIVPTVTWFNVFVGIPDSELYCLALNNRLYQYIDDRGLVYLQEHNSNVDRYYGGSWNAYIPDKEQNKDWTNRPQVSVLLCVYNGARFIAEALKSIYNQTYQDFELIVVDDGSIDSTPNILMDMKDSRTFIYRNAENQGLTKSLNIGLKLCRGDYIARMDADDISHPQRFEKQVRFLAENPECLAVGCWCNWIDSSGKTYGSWEPPTSYENIKKKLLVNNSLAHGSVMLRRSSLLEIGGYNEKYIYAQDYDLWLRLSEFGEIRNIPEHLYNLRSWTEAVSSARKKQQDGCAELARQEALQRKNIQMSRTTCGVSSSPQVSVVLTTYDRPKLLEKILSGFANQTARREDFEVIIVDDGSEPPVKEVVQKFSGQINTVYLYQPNSGLAAARNNGIRAARGQIVLFSDDDDMPGPELIAQHLRSHRQNPDERIAVLGHLDWHKDLQVTPLMHYITHIGGEYFGYDRLQDGQFYDVWKWWGGLISAKLSLLRSVEGPFDIGLRFGYEDTELACRLLHKDVKVLYNARARSFILRAVDFESFCKRRFLQGQALYRVASLHPEIIIPRYQLHDAANLYYTKYAPFLDDWTSKVIRFEALLNSESRLQRPDIDRYLRSLYIVYQQCFIGYWLKGYVEQFEKSKFETCPERSRGIRNMSRARSRDSKFPPAAGRPLRIAMVSTNTPGFDVGSSNLRIYHILKILVSSGHKIDYLYFSRYRDDSRYRAAFDGAINFIKVLGTVNSFSDYLHFNKVEKLDCVWITNLWSVDYLEWAFQLTQWLAHYHPQTMVFIDTMDFHYKKLMRKFNVTGDNNDLLNANRFLEVEKKLYPSADVVLTVTEVEKRDILETIGSDCNVGVIPNIHRIFTQQPNLQQREHICFLGSFYISHNADAVKWFRKEVWPLIVEKAPQVEFHILGFDNEKFKDELGDNPNVKVIGYVEDAESAVANYRLFVCPMTYGAGMKGKLGTAAAAGTPIVTTSIGAEGFDFVDGQDCFIADEPQDFADKCLRLLSEDSLWSQFSTKAKAMVAEKFSIEAVTEKIQALLQRVTRVSEREFPISNFQFPISTPGTAKVSIITSCYNCEKFLPECLDSIRNQTMPQWELFLLDDGSTDGTRSIIEQYSRMDQRIEPYYFQDNKGPYLRRNFAIERANSDFIVIQDVDDIMSPSKLQVLYRQINSDNRLGIVGAFYYIFLDEFRGLKYTDPVELPTEHSDIIDRQSSWQNSITHGSAIIRKTLFDAIGPYDENPFASDSFWLVKAAEYAKYCTDVKFKNIPEYLTFVRVHHNSQTGLLPLWDQRSRRFRYRCYCECKLKKIRPRLAKLSQTDLRNELRNCVCSDFLERFNHDIIRWESVPLDNNVIQQLLGNSVWLFNQSFYVSCISMLRGIEQMQPNIETRFRNYDLLRAMALFALDTKKQSLMYLNREIQNHNNLAAKQFISDYFEKRLRTDVQKWCAENSDLYDLRLIDSKIVCQTVGPHR